MYGFRDRFGRFAPPREWELCLFGFALLSLASVPLAWLLHGFGGVRSAWTVIPLAICLIGAGWWLRRKRVSNSRLLP
jgi:uncharacterized membrane protein